MDCLVHGEEAVFFDMSGPQGAVEGAEGKVMLHGEETATGAHHDQLIPDDSHVSYVAIHLSKQLT